MILVGANFHALTDAVKLHLRSSVVFPVIDLRQHTYIVQITLHESMEQLNSSRIRSSAHHHFTVGLCDSTDVQ